MHRSTRLRELNNAQTHVQALSCVAPSVLPRIAGRLPPIGPSGAFQTLGASAPLPKFVIHSSTFRHELRKQRGTSKSMILVPLFDLKFLNEIAARGAGTSNRRHWPKRKPRLETGVFVRVS